MTSLTLHLYSHAGLSTCGQAIRVKNRKSLELLAFLTIHGTQNRQALAQVLWPNSASAQARASLRNCLAETAKVLGPGLLEVSTHEIALLRRIDCAIPPFDSDNAYRGDFMPEFESDWVIDVRLAKREEAVHHAIQVSQATKDPKMSRLWAEKALQVDPLHQGAAHNLASILEAQGELHAATAKRDSFNARMLREVGVAPPVATKGTVTDPIVKSIEWMLEHNPKEALMALASSQQHLNNIEPQISIDLHFRALAFANEHCSANRLIRANLFYLYWITGQGTQHLADIKQLTAECMSEQESDAVVRIAIASAYCNLSLGNEKEAEKQAKLAVAQSAQCTNGMLRCDALQALGVIYVHTGKKSRGWKVHRDSSSLIAEHGSNQQVAAQRMQLIDECLAHGKPDQALEHLLFADRLYRNLGASRMQVWSLLGFHDIAVAAGDYEQAQTILDQIRNLGEGVAGQAGTAMLEDRQGVLYTLRGELDEAVTAFSRASKYRATKGSVRSTAERTSVLPAQRKLREKLNGKDFARFRRAAN